MYEVTISRKPSQKKIRFDSIFALPPFVELQSEGSGKQFFYVNISNARTGICTTTPVILTRFGGLRTASCLTPPQIISGPIGSRWKDIISFLIYGIKTNFGCVAISINQRPHDPRFIQGELRGYKLVRDYDVVIDLSVELKMIYDRMDKRCRYNLRRSSGCFDDDLLSSKWLQRTSYRIGWVADRETLREFRVLWVDTLQRLHENLGLLGRIFYRDPLTFSQLTNAFSKLSQLGLVGLFTIYDENEQPGASVILYTSRCFTRMSMAYWSAGASSEEGRRKGLPTLLQWYIIQWLKEHGYQRYYMGGYDARNPDSGPSLFKKSFGGRIVSGLTATWLARPLSLLNSLASNAENMIGTIKAAF
jgi:hypothetical protein